MLSQGSLLDLVSLDCDALAQTVRSTFGNLNLFFAQLQHWLFLNELLWLEGATTGDFVMNELYLVFFNLGQGL